MYTCITFNSWYDYNSHLFYIFEKKKNLEKNERSFFSFLMMVTNISTVSIRVSLLLMNICDNSVLGNLWTLSSSLARRRHIKGKITHISPPIGLPLCRFTFPSHITRWYIAPLLNFLHLSPKPQGCSPTLYVYPLGPWWGLRSCWPWKVHQSNEAGCESMYMGVWDREDGLIELRDGLFPPAGAVKQQVDAIIRAGRWGEDLFTAGLAWPGSICCPV